MQEMIAGSVRFPREGHGNLLQYSHLENPHGFKSLSIYIWTFLVTVRKATVHKVTKSQT